jgi:hypothetical protein
MMQGREVMMMRMGMMSGVLKLLSLLMVVVVLRMRHN